jgi:hypothetical protein
VRHKATDLIGELSGETRRQSKRRAKASASRTQVPVGQASDLMKGRRKRRLSAATRAKMRLAAKKRWAERKKTGG